MASIDKLSIRGIRSFSPDQDDQVIQFFSPLTIIVGKNGWCVSSIRFLSESMHVFRHPSLPSPPLTFCEQWENDYN